MQIKEIERAKTVGVYFLMSQSPSLQTKDFVFVLPERFGAKIECFPLAKCPVDSQRLCDVHVVIHSHCFLLYLLSNPLWNLQCFLLALMWNLSCLCLQSDRLSNVWSQTRCSFPEEPHPANTSLYQGELALYLRKLHWIMHGGIEALW